MISLKSPGTYSSTGILSAFAASLCCISPVMALLAGSSSVAANFLWIEPARPYLIGLSITFLGVAWYQRLKPAKTTDVDCNCDITKKTSLLQSITLLSIVTIFAIIILTFPLYAKVFYPKPKVHAATQVAVDNMQQAKFIIQGMTCAGCEQHVNLELSKVAGITAYKTSYASRSSLVTFDKSKVDFKTIVIAINKTGYKVKEYQAVTDKKKQWKNQ